MFFPCMDCFIDIEHFNLYLFEIKEFGIYFPIIINNDVSAMILHNEKVNSHIFVEKKLNLRSTSPLTHWYQQSSRAVASHTHFMEEASKYTLYRSPIPYVGRISIQFFGGRMKTIKEYFDAFLKFKDSDDEAFFTYHVYDKKLVANASSTIIPFFTVAHFSYRTQKGDWKDSILSQYEDLSKRICHRKYNINCKLT